MSLIHIALLSFFWMISASKPSTPDMKISRWSCFDSNCRLELVGAAGITFSNYSLVLYRNSGKMINSFSLKTMVFPNQGNGRSTIGLPLSAEDSELLSNADGVALVLSQSMVIQFSSLNGTFTAKNGPAEGMNSFEVHFGTNSRHKMVSEKIRRLAETMAPTTAQTTAESTTLSPTTAQTTAAPTMPSTSPTNTPTLEPTAPSTSPTNMPTMEPTAPSTSPTPAPSTPTKSPSLSPSAAPTEATLSPTGNPTVKPTGNPTTLAPSEAVVETTVEGESGDDVETTMDQSKGEMKKLNFLVLALCVSATMAFFC